MPCWIHLSTASFGGKSKTLKVLRSVRKRGIGVVPNIVQVPLLSSPSTYSARRTLRVSSRVDHLSWISTSCVLPRPAAFLHIVRDAVSHNTLPFSRHGRLQH